MEAKSNELSVGEGVAQAKLYAEKLKLETTYSTNGKEITKILCLDPGYPTPKFTYWNSVVDLKPYRGKYNFRNITESGKCQYVGQ